MTITTAPSTTCDLCETARTTGWWGRSGISHCRKCHRTWTSKREAHCPCCCRHFASDTSCEAHKVYGDPELPPTCLPPEDIRDTDGGRRFVHDDTGTWSRNLDAHQNTSQRG